MVRRASRRPRLHIAKAKIREIKCIDKHIDGAHRVVLVNPILKALWQQCCLLTIHPNHEACHLYPHRFSGRFIAQQVFSHSLGH
jgi:hypothetical protein